MSFRFRRSVRIIPGVRLNLSKSGVSVSVGGPGATLNLNSRGSSVTVGLPGTGLSYRHQLTSPRHPPSQSASSAESVWLTSPASAEPPPAHASPEIAGQAVLPGEIRSAEIVALTSHDLAGLKALINEASSQKLSLEVDLASALSDRLKAWKKLRRREQFPLSPFYKRRLPAFQAAFAEADGETLKVVGALAVSEVRVHFEFDAATNECQRALESAHRRLSMSARIWDVTSSTAINRYTTRSAASEAITRNPIRLSSVTDGVIAGNQLGLRFQNANGADLDFFPGFLLMRERGASDYALIDLREVALDVQPIKFIEHETVPHDAEIVGQAWAKANKDGSPDRRFANNHQKPIVRYGEISFRTRSGLNEAYQASDCDAAVAFGEAFVAAQEAMRSQGTRPTAAPPVTSAGETTINLDERLPALPPVGGAHGITLAVIALLGLSVAVGAEFFGLPLSSRIPVHRPRMEMPEPRSGPVSALLGPSTLTQGPTTPSVAAPLRPAPAAPATVKSRFVTKQAARLRSSPDRNASVLKSVSGGTVFQVFNRDKDWAQVGDEVPIGWIHASLLVPPPN